VGVSFFFFTQSPFDKSTGFHEFKIKISGFKVVERKFALLPAGGLWNLDEA
jgi:hypothetical protein